MTDAAGGFSEGAGRTKQAPRLEWLAEPTAAALKAAIAQVRPDLADATIQMRADGTGGAPEWRRGSAQVGDDHFVKFAWSAPAARKLWHETEVTRLLSRAAPDLPLASVEAASAAPLLLITRRLGGAPIWYPEVSAFTDDERGHFAAQFARFLRRLHEPTVLSAIEDALAPLPQPVPQGTTAALRERLGSFVGADRAVTVAHWCDWVDEVQAEATSRVLLHGDFAGHNVLWDAEERVLKGVVDFEEAAAGDPNYDLRYLPSQADTLALLHDVIDEYTTLGGEELELRKVMAWSVRTVLGDALWRSEAGIGLPFGGNPREWVDEMEQRLAEAEVLH